MTELERRIRTIVEDVQFFLPFEDCAKVSRAVADQVAALLGSRSARVHVAHGSFDSGPHAWVEIPALNMYIDPTFEQFDPAYNGWGWKNVRIGALGDADYALYEVLRSQ